MGSERTGGLDVAIVSYRCRELLHECLSSLRQNPPQRRMRVVVFDNASEDGSAEMVRDDFPEFELIGSDQNLGFAVGSNRAIAAGGAEYVLALNPDTKVLAGALDTVLATIESHPDVGIAGCRLERPDGSLDHAAKRSFPTPASALGHFVGAGRRSGAKGKLAAYRAPHVERGPVDAVNGAFMLIRRQAFEALGGFDERYWMYMEDLDLCYRMAEAGWRTYYEPAATVIHVKAGTSGPNRSPRLNRAFHGGMFRFYRDHYAAERPPITNAAVYAGIGLKLGLAIFASAVRSARDRVRSRR